MGVPASSATSTRDSDPPPSNRAVSSKQILDAVAILVFLAAIAAAFWFMHRYAVNVIINDQWTDINVIQHAHTGTLNFDVLWAQHNESRILFPNLIVLALAYTTQFNIVVEDYLSVFLLCVATGLLILAHRRRAPELPWIWYCPVVLAFLAFDVLARALFGFLLCWFLVLLGLALTVFILDRLVLTWVGLSGAAVAAVVASFSSLQGLLVWPAGFVLLYLRRRSRAFMLAWIATAVATTCLNYLNYDFGAAGGSGSYVRSHPIAAIRLFVYAMGDVIGVRAQPPYLPDRGGHYQVLAVGALIIVVAVWAMIHGFGRGRSGASPVGVALIVFGLLFDASIAVGRLQLGLSNVSRYMPFEATLWVGAYLALFDQPIRWTRQTVVDWQLRLDYLLGIRRRPVGDTQGTDRLPAVPRDRIVEVTVKGILVVLVFVRIVSAPYIGLIDARSWHKRELKTVELTVNIQRTSDSVVQEVLGSYPAGFIRQMAEFARSQGLSLFSSSVHSIHIPGKSSPRMVRGFGSVGNTANCELVSTSQDTTAGPCS